MRRLLISTALLLLTAPAFAQPMDPSQIRGKGGFGQYQQQQQQQRQDRAQRQQAAPQPQQRSPQTGPRDRGNRDANRSRDNNRDVNRAGRDWRQGGNNDRRPGYAGPRRDYSGFRDYRRSYNSSRRFRAPSYRRPQGWYDRRWTFGEFLPSLFWASSYWLNDFNRYDLPPPPYGTVWVRNGDDALLIDRDSGEIISVRYAVFY